MFLRLWGSCEDVPKAMPLFEALDKFRKAFNGCYPIEHDELAEGSQACQEDLEGVEDHAFLNKVLHSKYFLMISPTRAWRGMGQTRRSRGLEPAVVIEQDSIRLSYLEKYRQNADAEDCLMYHCLEHDCAEIWREDF
ncbi:hypothetical protein F4819DRAFT_489433 [Hypoxylon fuscum]|nr:hypothetical protein F4819DRAFT_489433 [Hypoxylon fuscum]